jgi:hypothetical protein
MSKLPNQPNIDRPANFKAYQCWMPFVRQHWSGPVRIFAGDLRAPRGTADRFKLAQWSITRIKLQGRLVRVLQIADKA